MVRELGTELPLAHNFALEYLHFIRMKNLAEGLKKKQLPQIDEVVEEKKQDQERPVINPRKRFAPAEDHDHSSILMNNGFDMQ